MAHLSAGVTNFETRPVPSGGIWIFISAAVFTAATAVPEVGRGRIGTAVGLLAFAVVFLGPAVLNRRSRLRVVGDVLEVDRVILRRSVDLSSLVEVRYVRGSSAAAIKLRDTRGKRLTLQSGGWLNSDVWAAHVLEAADHSGAEVDPRARRALNAMDAQGNVFLA